MAVKGSKGSKNNISNRGETAKLRMFDGKAVKPVRYVSETGNYIAGRFEDGKLVKDKSGKPIPYGLI